MLLGNPRIASNVSDGAEKTKVKKGSSPQRKCPVRVQGSARGETSAPFVVPDWGRIGVRGWWWRVFIGRSRRLSWW
jgi:hypothetical protein